MELPIIECFNPPDSFIIDKRNLYDNSQLIAKIYTKTSHIKDTFKIEEFTNKIITELYNKKHINITKAYGGRINILVSIIKKINIKVLFVCKNCSESDKYAEIFYNYQLCSVTQLIKIKTNKIVLSDYELVIFIDINESQINSDWVDKKLSIILNNKKSDCVEIINADEFFLKELTTEIYSFDSKNIFNDVGKFIKKKESENIIILVNKRDFIKLFGNFDFKYKLNNLLITTYEKVIEGFDIKNFDTIYFLHFTQEKAYLNQIITRFIKTSDFYIK